LGKEEEEERVRKCDFLELFSIWGFGGGGAF